MNTHVKNPVVIRDEDYELLRPYISNVTEREGEMTLSSELKRAVIVAKEAFPPNTIGLNSKISIQDLETDKIKEITLVMPAHIDVQNNKFSILTPMGAALIGFRAGEEVSWKMPAGIKRFRILEVVN